jgi:hypothetical protein
MRRAWAHGRRARPSTGPSPRPLHSRPRRGHLGRVLAGAGHAAMAGTRRHSRAGGLPNPASRALRLRRGPRLHVALRLRRGLHCRPSRPPQCLRLALAWVRGRAAHLRFEVSRYACLCKLAYNLTAPPRVGSEFLSYVQCSQLPSALLLVYWDENCVADVAMASIICVKHYRDS